ncbi:MAG: hypothetical protein JSR58_03030 [Verrucomicrobia bacterium]|nr:hypothetical protein [Verrucomicrobiota bacterium]
MSNSVSFNLKFYCEPHAVEIYKKKYESFSLKEGMTEKLIAAACLSYSLKYNDRIFEVFKKKFEFLVQNAGFTPPSIVLSLTRIGIRIREYRDEVLEFFETDKEFAQQAAKAVRLSMKDVKASWSQAADISFKAFEEYSEEIQGEKAFSLPCDIFQQKSDKSLEYNVEDLLKREPVLFSAVFRQLGLKQGAVPLVFTKQNYDKFKVAVGVELIKSASFLTCFGYVLLQMGELRAKEYIFYRKSSFDMKFFLPMLIDWDYQVVSDPRENDLVVYVDAKNTVQHAGKITREGKVDSKLGIANSFAWEHDLFEVPPHFGSKVIFLRKV